MGVKWPISHIWWSSSPFFIFFPRISCVADRKHGCSGTINVASMNLFHNFFVASILIIPGSLIPTFFVKLSLAKWTSYHLPSEPLGGPLPTFELSVGRTGSVRKSPLTWHKIQNDQVIRGWTSRQSQHLIANDPMVLDPQPNGSWLKLSSIDWFKGTITRKSYISWENLRFPVDFSLSQPIEVKDKSHRSTMAGAEIQSHICTEDWPTDLVTWVPIPTTRG